MEIKAHSIVAKDTESLILKTREYLKPEDNPNLKLVLSYTTAKVDSNKLNIALRELLGETSYAGTTSCLGYLSQEGWYGEGEFALGIMTFQDTEDSAYGVGMSENKDPILCGREACKKAVLNADREGELPDFLWVMCSPGQEESHIKGIEEYFGTFVPVFGGSSADNTISGEWSLFCNEGRYQSGLIVTAFYSDNPPVGSYHCGYEPTGQQAKVTSAKGRVIEKLNGEPAAHVYNKWTQGIIDENIKGKDKNILSKTTLFPLGRQKLSSSGLSYFLLSHPDHITEESGLSLFSEVKEGEEVFLMKGTIQSLEERASEVAKALMSREGLTKKDIAGALVIYCAGCMLAVNSSGNMDRVLKNLKVELGEVPILGAFTFGEQGCLLEEENLHGNLMISVTLFKI